MIRIVIPLDKQSSTTCRLIATEMWNGMYERWHPLQSWSDRRVEIEAVHDDWDGFRIWIRSHDEPKGMLIVRFDDAKFYCNSDEGYRISSIEPSQPTLEFPHVFWRVSDSELVRVFNRQSCGIHSSDGLVHYSFLSCNDCVDVISCFPPKFEGNWYGKDDG